MVPPAARSSAASPKTIGTLVALDP